MKVLSMNGQTLREQDLKPNNRTPAQDLVDQVDPILDMAKPEQQNQTLMDLVSEFCETFFVWPWLNSKWPDKSQE